MGPRTAPSGLGRSPSPRGGTAGGGRGAAKQGAKNATKHARKIARKTCFGARKFGKYVFRSKNSTTDTSGEKRASARDKFGMRFFRSKIRRKNTPRGDTLGGHPPGQIFHPPKRVFHAPKRGVAPSFRAPKAGFSRFEVGYSRPRARCFLPRGQKGREGQEADSRPCTQHSISYLHAP